MWVDISTVPHMMNNLFNAEQGQSLALALENLARAFHLNVTKHLVTSMGPLLLLQSAVYSRIGNHTPRPSGGR